MGIARLRIDNYKSLRHLEFAPHDLAVVVGANAAGKSNLADCLDFISEVYRHGLEVAVARKGGYENIAHRKQRRSKGSIGITILVHFTGVPPLYTEASNSSGSDSFSFRAQHTFNFAVRGQSIRADFAVTNETLLLDAQVGDSWVRLGALSRTPSGLSVESMSDADLAEAFPTTNEITRRYYLSLEQFRTFVEHRAAIPNTELLALYFGRFFGPLSAFVDTVQAIRVFQITPTTSRQFGAPTPRPELDRYGANLPAVVDFIQRTNKGAWILVMQAMARILPSLERIEIDYTTARTLGLFFHERGVGRPWSVAEVSDGTVQTLALLVAIFDPRARALVIEEPENSIHPWIIRTIVTACVNASMSKQILITTHSPVVVNSVPPEKVWVMWRRAGESHLAPFFSLDPQLHHLWETGAVATFDMLDSGTIQEAVPPPPDLDLEFDLGPQSETEP
jgi:predicted ATPase